jgi:two-component system phosphate regulon response regulator PhoB
MKLNLDTADILDLRGIKIIIPYFRVYDKNDQEIPLTPLEFKLLLALAKHIGAPIARGDLIKIAWGNIHVEKRTVDAHISDLRKKIKNTDHSIKTVRSVGYELI